MRFEPPTRLDQVGRTYHPGVMNKYWEYHNKLVLCLWRPAYWEYHNKKTVPDEFWENLFQPQEVDSSDDSAMLESPISQTSPE